MESIVTETTFTRYCAYGAEPRVSGLTREDVAGELIRWQEYGGKVQRYDLTTRDGFDLCVISLHLPETGVQTAWFTAPVMDNTDGDYYATCTTGAQYRYRAANVFEAMKLHNATRPGLRASVARWQEGDRPGRKGMVYHWHESA